MPAINDLVPLLYRARWIRFSLSGEVRSWRAGPNRDEELSGSVLAAPGGRYRADLVDEDGEAELTICDGQSGGIPFPELLAPSWLLADFDLEITGKTMYIGRPAYAIGCAPRQPGNGGADRHDDRVTALVDAELGLLLRYEKVSRGRPVEAAEFRSLTVAGAESADPELFTGPPPGEPDQGRAWPGSMQAPDGMSPPDLSDDQVNLLYRSDLEPQQFSADLHEWTDVNAISRLSAAALSATDLGRRTRWLWQADSGHPLEDVDLAARLTVAMPGRYRIDAVTDPGTRPTCTACNGDRLWLVYPDHIAVRPAAPLPAALWPLLDPARLLNSSRLSAEETAAVSGRPGLRIVTAEDGDLSVGPLSRTPVAADTVETTVDLDLGVALRKVWYLDGHPVMRTELSALTADIDPATFQIEPASGSRVITGGLLAEAGLTPAGAAWMAARGAAGLAADIGRRWARRPRP